MLAGAKDTICALSTPAGIGGISVIRICGTRAWEISYALAPSLPEKIQSHRAYFAEFLDERANAIDEGLILFFAQGNSYAGDETAEVSCHGNPQIVEELLKRLVMLGCRPAGRGEFTMRAFLNGRIDLAQAEGVLGLIESESQDGRRISLRQLKGDLSKKFLLLEEGLVHVLAHIEAAIDFSTEDIEVVNLKEMRSKLSKLLEVTKPLLESFSQGKRINEGFIVSLVGEPNVGKSSLLNAFLSDDRAIVSSIAGTTRDVVEGSLRLGGRTVHFRDTAGLRPSLDEVEAEGIRRSLRAAEESDLVFLVMDGSNRSSFDRVDSQLLELRRTIKATRVVILINKADLGEPQRILDTQGAFEIFSISAKEGFGVAETLELVERASRIHFSTEIGVLTSLRHFEGLKKVQLAIESADQGILAGHSSDIVCLDLREALFSIQLLLGKQFEESVIDRIFSDFCIGK